MKVVSVIAGVIFAGFQVSSAALQENETCASGVTSSSSSSSSSLSQSSLLQAASTLDKLKATSEEKAQCNDPTHHGSCSAGGRPSSMSVWGRLTDDDGCLLMRGNVKCDTDCRKCKCTEGSTLQEQGQKGGSAAEGSQRFMGVVPMQNFEVCVANDTVEFLIEDKDGKPLAQGSSEKCRADSYCRFHKWYRPWCYREDGSWGNCETRPMRPTPPPTPPPTPSPTACLVEGVQVAGAENVNSPHFRNRMGSYNKTDDTQSSRPVYKRSGSDLYLYYWASSTRWVIGTDWKSDSGHLRSDVTPAFCPNEVPDGGWMFWRYGKWKTDPKVTVTDQAQR